MTTEQGEELAKELGIPYIETSAKANTNVEEAFFNLAREVKTRLIDTAAVTQASSTATAGNVNVNSAPQDRRRRWLLLRYRFAVTIKAGSDRLARFSALTHDNNNSASIIVSRGMALVPYSPFSVYMYNDLARYRFSPYQLCVAMTKQGRTQKPSDDRALDLTCRSGILLSGQRASRLSALMLSFRSAWSRVEAFYEAWNITVARE